MRTNEYNGFAPTHILQKGDFAVTYDIGVTNEKSLRKVSLMVTTINN